MSLCVVFGAAAAAYLPSLSNGFVYWDDNDTIFQNPHIRSLDGASLRWMFTTFRVGLYQPLYWLSLAVDYRLWGLDSFGYHLTSLLLHAANAALFFLLARRLLAAASPGEQGPRLDVPAALAALLFALHPLRVESTAWATERRDLLSGLFYLSCVLAHLRAIEPGAPRAWRALSLACFAASLLSKGIGITLPLSLLLLDAYPLRRLDRRALIEKAPYLALSLLFGTLGLWAEKADDNFMSWSLHGAGARLAQALHGLVFYARKTLWPADLIALYELPRFVFWSAKTALDAALVGGASALAWRLRASRPALGVALAHYALTLGPVLGFVQFGAQATADRYSYLSCLPWPLLAAGALRESWLGRRRAPWAWLGAGALASVLLAVLTVRQAATWKDTETLWRHALSVNPLLAQGHNNLGLFLLKQGRIAEAVPRFHTALAIIPDYPYALRNLADVRGSQGRCGEAIALYDRLYRQGRLGPKGAHNAAICLDALGQRELAAKLRKSIPAQP